MMNQFVTFREDMNFATTFPDSEEAGQSEIQAMPSKVHIKF